MRHLLSGLSRRLALHTLRYRARSSLPFVPLFLWSFTFRSCVLRVPTTMVHDLAALGLSSASLGVIVVVMVTDWLLELTVPPAIHTGLGAAGGRAVRRQRH